MERLSIPFLEISVPTVLLYEMQKGNGSSKKTKKMLVS